MLDNQCTSKNKRRDYQPGRDMLSELPLSIIHIILALVPIRDAVKTSILSRQWRYTWTGIPWLEFEEHSTIQDYKSRDKFEDHMEIFITHVLFFHKGPIEKFELSIQFRRNCQNIGVWLRCLARNDIKELIIDMDYSDSSWTQELQSSIYSCKKLTKLELYNCKLDPPPTTFKAFLFLRCLFLREIDLPTKEVESLVANCPLLENFTSYNCGNPELRISAPNLKFLNLYDDYIEISVDAPLLAELWVDLQDYGNRFSHLHDSSICNYTNLMGSFTNNLEKLSGHSYFTKHLSMGIESCHHTLVFHRLKDIELDEVNFEDINAVSVVVILLGGAPNLQYLQISNLYDIEVEQYYSCQEVPHISYYDFGRVPNFKLEKLRAVYMGYVNTGLPPQMAFIKFLLERSPVLEKMYFGGVSPEKQQNLSAELEGCTRASPNVKLAMTYY